jgi:SUR7/PalI family
MLLKPATPLSVMLFISFVLLLLSTLSTPVIKAIPLATYQNVDFGVFGYCKGSTCSHARVGYDTGMYYMYTCEGLWLTDEENIFGTSESDSSEFNLSSSARNYLSAILIVHPVAAFLVLVCFIMAVASHLHSPSHSPRYLLALLILLLPTVLVTLLAFLVDILLFVPHLQWGGWIVLAATILLVACGVVTCAMRRTLVSRKARKKLVSENAEMSGENFYARQDAEAAAAGIAKAESPPPLGSDLKTPLINSHADSAPTFSTYDSRTTDDGSHTLVENNTFATTEESTAFYDSSTRPVRPGYHGPRDEYGNAIPPAASSGMAEGGMMRSNSSERMLQSQYSDGSLGSQRGPGPQAYGQPQPPRGRGYPPRGGYRGGPGQAPYGSRRGPPPGRGSMRGRPPPGAMPRGRGPPPGYPPHRDGPGYDQYAMGGRRPSDGSGGYGLSRSDSNNYSRPYPPRSPSASQPNLEMNDPGHAIEMMPQSSEPTNLRVRNGDDLAQPNRFSNNESLPSPTSVYSNE